jgi:hypothetical protein
MIGWRRYRSVGGPVARRAGEQLQCEETAAAGDYAQVTAVLALVDDDEWFDQAVGGDVVGKRLDIERAIGLADVEARNVEQGKGCGATHLCVSGGQ